jgi:hypothetical protein
LRSQHSTQGMSNRCGLSLGGWNTASCKAVRLQCASL